MLIGHLYIFFGEMSIQVLCLFLNWVIWGFLLLSCISSLYILDSHISGSFTRYMIGKYFILFCGLPFYSNDTVFWCTKFKVFVKPNLSIFFFCCLCLWHLIREIVTKSSVMKFCPMLSCSKFSFKSYIFGLFWVNCYMFY